MEQYQVDKIYELTFVTNDTDNLLLADSVDDSYYVRAYRYQVLNNYRLPKRIRCIVISIADGKPVFQQIYYDVLSARYTIGEKYNFLICAKEKLANGTYKLKLKDDDLYHEYIASNNFANYEVGDYISLRINEIVSGIGNSARLLFSAVYNKSSSGIITDSIYSRHVNVSFKELYCSVLDENWSIDKAFVRTVAGLINSTGGVIAVGVDEHGLIRGINEDLYKLDYRNLSIEYEDFILDSLCRQFDIDAKSINDIIKIKKFGLEKKPYCIINIMPSNSMPVYVEGINLYVRRDEKTVLLKGNEITNYIRNKIIDIRRSVNDRLEQDNELDKYPDIDCDGAINLEVEEPPLTEDKIENKNEVWYYMNLHGNGDLSYTERLGVYDDIKYTIAIPNESRNKKLLLCYSNGKIAAVIPEKLLIARRRRKERLKNMWTPVDIKKYFFVEKSDLILLRFNCDGINRVKIIDENHFKVKDFGISSGVIAINMNQYKIRNLEICKIPESYKDDLKYHAVTYNISGDLGMDVNRCSLSVYKSVNEIFNNYGIK